MYLLEESMSLLHVNVNIYKGEVDLWILKKKKKRETRRREEGETEGGKEEGGYLIPYGNVYSPIITVSCHVQFPHKLCNL